MGEDEDMEGKMPSNILSKEQFVAIIEKVVAAHDVSNKLSQAIRDTRDQTGADMLVDFFDPFVLYSGCLNELVETLSVMFHDENEWISWWLFECDYGHDSRLLSGVRDANGDPVAISTPGELYDLLVAEMPKV